MDSNYTKMFSDHSGLIFDINNRKISEKFPNIRKLNILINNK